MKIYKQITTKQEVDVDSGVMHYAVTENIDSCGNNSEKIIALFEHESRAKIFASKMNDNYDERENVWFNICQLAKGDL